MICRGGIRFRVVFHGAIFQHAFAKLYGSTYRTDSRSKHHANNFPKYSYKYANAANQGPMHINCCQGSTPGKRNAGAQNTAKLPPTDNCSSAVEHRNIAITS